MVVSCMARPFSRAGFSSRPHGGADVIGPPKRLFSSARWLGTSNTTAQPAEIPCDPHSLRVEVLELAQLDVAQRGHRRNSGARSSSRTTPLLDEVVGLHRREIVRELLHAGGLPPRVAEPAEQEDDEK